MGPQLAQKSCICHGDCEGLLLLRNHYDLPLQAEHAYRAASSGNVRMLQWLPTHGFPFTSRDKQVCRFAAEGGHLQALQWLRQAGSKWNSHMLRSSRTWAFGGAAVGARQLLPLEQGGLLRGGGRRAP
eukprot:TRINITY_DN8286_c1_g1_i2.p2 TRINITY_DN8286_c1_g1~~TRINITY_DN8286_c1_g1_i2.p2  ORF type:complete len:128 (-),score=32.61 TRINITY_DN8286_c1_g1_i2:161-544(-)